MEKNTFFLPTIEISYKNRTINRKKKIFIKKKFFFQTKIYAEIVKDSDGEEKMRPGKKSSEKSFGEIKFIHITHTSQSSSIVSAKINQILIPNRP